MQAKVKTVLNEGDITLEYVKEHLSQLYGTSDAEILYTVLKTGEVVPEEAKEEEQIEQKPEPGQEDLEVKKQPSQGNQFQAAQIAQQLV